jgi:Ribonuclease G/E
MKQTLLIDHSPFDARIALIEQGEVVALDFELASERGQEEIARAGSIYLGQVMRIAKELDAALVDIGLAQPGFLASNHAQAQLPGKPKRLPIERLVQEGQRLIVQVLRPAIGQKGPKLTANIAADGRWAEAQSVGKMEKKPGLLAGETQLIPALLERWALHGLDEKKTISEILVSDDACFAEVRRWAGRRAPDLDFNLQRDRGAGDLFERYGAAAALESALARRVALAGGGSLVIDETEALTAIDVDSAADRNTDWSTSALRQSKAAAALQINLAAANEIARQLRLRSLGGVAVIDFLRLKNRGEMSRLMAHFAKALRRDPIPSRVLAPSALGLVEMARPRLGLSLGQKVRWPDLDQGPNSDNGRGAILHPAVIAGQIIRQLTLSARSAPRRAWRVVCSTPVAARLMARQSELEVAMGTHISVAADSARGDDFDIAGA